MTDSRRPPIVIHMAEDSINNALAFGVREAHLHGCGIRFVLHARGVEAPGSATSLLQRAAARARELAGPHVDVTTLLTDVGADSLLDSSQDALAVVLQHRHVLHLVNALTRGPASGSAADARTPVVCLPLDWTPTPVGSQPVTVGVESPSQSRTLLRQSLRVAREHRTSLRVVHTWSFPQPFDDLIVTRVGAEWNEHARREIAEVLARHDGGSTAVPVEIDVRHGAAVDTLLSRAADSELLVLGLNSRRQPAGWRLGRVARAVLHDSSSPVLLLPTAGLRPGAEASPARRSRPRSR
jgi:nucleotide-binding universal stress UspA family protein